MKKLIVVLMTAILATSAFARGPRVGFRGAPPPPPRVHYHHHSWHGGDWAGFTLGVGLVGAVIAEAVTRQRRLRQPQLSFSPCTRQLPCIPPPWCCQAALSPQRLRRFPIFPPKSRSSRHPRLLSLPRHLRLLRSWLCRQHSRWLFRRDKRDARDFAGIFVLTKPTSSAILVHDERSRV